MSALMCCFWWFLLGILIGWLLNWLLSGWLRGDGHSGGNSSGGVHPNSFASANSGLTATTGATTGAASASAPTATASGVNFVAAAAAGFHVLGEDDLAIIEGIGPKIRALFNEQGVSTFAQVSKLSVAQMKVILEKGGSRFKLANPGSWAQQADLAHRNEWAALKKLQDELDAGVAHH